jgi:hypothetical protein
MGWVHMSARFIFAALFLTILLSGCARSYEGDGELSDQGLGTARERYRLDLGLVDLSSGGAVMFKMKGLPAEEFTAGLEGISHCVVEGSNSPIRVRLALSSAQNGVVISEEAPLREWNQSRGFWYRKGLEKEVPTTGEVTEIKRIGILADDGWGTYFTARPRSAYSLKLSVVIAQEAFSCPARLVLYGGGWK